MTQVIKLDNGGYLYNDFGKYAPNLTFLFSDKKVCMESWEVTEDGANAQRDHLINKCGYKAEDVHLEQVGWYEQEPFRNSVGEIVQPRKKIRISWFDPNKVSFNWQSNFTPMNIEKDGNITVLYGNFFVSKKGKNCFRLLDRKVAEHQLAKVDWGGCFNSTRGNIPDTMRKAALYYRCASSNGGGSGNTYVVVPKDWTASYSEEDL